MPTLTGADRALLRSGPPVVKYYLAIVPATVIFQASINNEFATWGDRILYYDGVTVGAWGDVTVGQTLYCYESDGTTYKGKVRIREIDGGDVTVAQNNDIEWADDDVLKVRNVFEPWSRPTGQEDTGDGTQYYKDTNVAWVDNNTSFPPKANDLGGLAGFLDGAGQADVPFDAGDSFANAPAATIASYARGAEDGAYIVGNANTAAGTIRFSATGFRWITETVTDSNGKTGLMRMPVWTFGGGYQPFKDFEIKRRSTNGRDWELQIEAWGDVTEDDLYPGAQIMLFSQTYIEGAEVTDDLNCPFPGRQPIKFSGWILDNSVRWNYETGVVTFAAGTIGKIADDMPGYATFLEDVPDGDESDWHSALDPTVRSTIFFLLHWHTTIPELAYFEIEPDEIIAGRKFRKAPPFKQVENAFLEDKGVFARLGCSKWGSVHIKYDPQIMSDADQALVPTVINLTSFDWLEELEIEKSDRPKASSVMGGGITYDGTTGTPYRGRAPGTKGLESGKDVRADNLIITGQGNLNTKLGRLLETEANPWDDIPILLMYDVFEPALQEYVTITVTAAENPRGHVLTTSAKWVIRGVAIEDVANGPHDVTLEVEGLASSLPGAGNYVGEDVPIPDPDGPPTPPPPGPPDEPPPPPISPGTGDWVVVGTVGGAGVCYTKNAVSGIPPTWFTLNNGLGNLDPIESLAMDPLKPFRLVCIDGDGDVYTNVSWHSDGVWQQVLTNANALSMLPTGAASVVLSQVYCGALVNGETYIVVVSSAVLDGPIGGTVFYWSYDFGGSWTADLVPTGHYAGFSLGTCDYLGSATYWAMWDRTNETTSGQILPMRSEQVGFAGRCTASGSQGRSNTGMMRPGGGRAIVGDYHPSWAIIACGDITAENVIKNGIGGSGALAFDWNGPLAMCLHPTADNTYYAASYKVHEDIDEDERLCVVRVDADVTGLVAGGWAYPGVEHSRGLGDMPGMMFTPPVGCGSIPWMGLRAWTDGETAIQYTDIYKGPSVVNGQVSIVGHWRHGKAFPELVDTIWAITYLGRSWVSGGKADASDPRVFLLSKSTAVNYAEAFADHTGNLYSLGAEGILDIHPDPTR